MSKEVLQGCLLPEGARLFRQTHAGPLGTGAEEPLGGKSPVRLEQIMTEGGRWAPGAGRSKRPSRGAFSANPREWN